MSILPPEVHSELNEILVALQSPENTVRDKAEEHLESNWTETRPEVLLMGLAELIAASNDASIRTFAAVIFRRIASKDRKVESGHAEMFISLTNEHATVIRQKLLEALFYESDSNTRKKISDAVADLARQYTDNDSQWPELLGVLFNLTTASDADQREVAFRVFATSPSIIESQYESAILQAFAQGFTDAAVPVRLTAMDAFSAFFRGIPKKSQSKYYSLLPGVLNILPPIKDSGDSEQLAQGLLALIELAEAAPKMFKALFSDLVNFSVTIIADQEFEDVCRQNALELMATFADYAASMCRKDANYTAGMIRACLGLMTELDSDDTEGWLASKDEQDESDMNHVAAEQCMDRLANKLGDGAFLDVAYPLLQSMLGDTRNEAWTHRHGALMAISAISEGCRNDMLSNLPQYLSLVVPALDDSHPRVQWAACQALGQMSTDFSPNIQAQYHNYVLVGLVQVLHPPGSFNNKVYPEREARVKAHAAAALVNFCEDAQTENLQNHLDDLVNHLARLVGANEKLYVQEQALSTIATIADAAKTTFVAHQSRLMEGLLQTMRVNKEAGNPTGNGGPEDTRLLRAKAMECATLIAMAVGQKNLKKDRVRPADWESFKAGGNLPPGEARPTELEEHKDGAQMLVDMLNENQVDIQSDDDPRAQYLVHCWGRMCKVLDKDFKDHLSKALPAVKKMAQSQADIKFALTDEEVEDMSQEEGWDLVPIKGKTIGIRTSLMDDKHMAIELLVVYAETLKEDFAHEVQNVMQDVVLPGLAFYFHDPVRYISAKLIPPLVESCRLGHAKNVASDLVNLDTLFNTAIDKLLAAIANEPAIENLAQMYEAFYESIIAMDRECVTPANLARFADTVQSAAKEYLDRVAQRKEDAEGDDAEDMGDELQLAIEDDQNLLADMNKSFHAVLKYHGPQFLGAFATLEPMFLRFLNTEVDPSTSRMEEYHAHRQWVLCIFDDFIEYCGRGSVQFQALLGKALAEGCNYQPASVLQVVANEQAAALQQANRPGEDILIRKTGALRQAAAIQQAAAIRQAAAYGIGVAAQHGGEEWSGFFAEPALIEALQQASVKLNPNDVPRALDSDPQHVKEAVSDAFDEAISAANYAAENASAAIAKILRFNNSRVVGPEAVLEQWFTTLPITNDSEAAPYVYAYIALLIQQQNPILSGKAEKIFVDVAQAIAADVIDQQTLDKLCPATQFLLQSAGVSPAKLEELLGLFSKEDAAKIKAKF